MNRAKGVVLGQLLRRLKFLAKNEENPLMVKAILQMTEDLWYQYLVLESFIKDEGEPNAKRKRISKKGKGQRALQPVPALQPPHTDLRGAG